MIPVNEPDLHQLEIGYAQKCLETGWISSSGEFIEQFEQIWAEYCGMEHGIAVCNGTVALELAIRCLDLAPGDEIILPAFTIISCAQAIIQNGAKPVLVDSDPETWCMDVNQIEARITNHTRAIMPVHIYGHPVDMDPLQKLAEKYSLVIIEDAAEAHGAEYLSHANSPAGEWRKCGGFGHLSTFSFYANKPITTGEGGMVLTHDADIAVRMRQLRNLCFTSERRFLHQDLGYNFRMTNIQAALGFGQAQRIVEIIARKRQIGEKYKDALKNIPGIVLQDEKEWARSIYWMFGLVVDDDRALSAVELARQAIRSWNSNQAFFPGNA